MRSILPAFVGVSRALRDATRSGTWVGRVGCFVFLAGMLLVSVAVKAGAADIPRVAAWDLKPLPVTARPLVNHPPFETGDCSLCHASADPANPGPVLKAGNALCFGCHEDYPAVLGRKFGHAPASERCVNCHNPHNSTERRLLHLPVKELCFSCHKDIHELAENSAVKHGALSEESKCLACHNPHGANVEHLLKQMPRDLCLRCHNRDNITDAAGHKLTNMSQLFEQNPLQHGALQFGDCSACHNPHGFENFRLLNEEYPADFYSQYDAKLYALCFECHESSAFTEPETTVLTQFRDGPRNLHFLHVNKEDLGRTCRACHEVHASQLPHLIRSSVPYGDSGWMLKVNYKNTPTGGSCIKTCHGEQAYNNSVGGPGVGPVPDHALSARVKHPAIGSTVVDQELATFDGNREHVFKDNQATVVIFFKPGQDHSRTVLQQISRLLPQLDGKPVRWLGVVSDRFAKLNPAEEVARLDLPFPVVIDVGDQLYGRLGIVQEPAFAFVDADRRFAGFQSFQKVNMVEVLRARVLRLLGEITEQELESTLRPPPLPSQAIPLAHTRLRLAERLLMGGKMKLALEGVRVSIAEDPKSAAAHALHGQVLSLMGQIPAARTAYETAIQLDPGNEVARTGLETLGL